MGRQATVRRTVDARTTTSRAPNPPQLERFRELQQSHARLQRDYADLHAALSEGLRVHRRLCAPRLVRLAATEIASEVFAVRYLPGDFFTVEERDDAAILALGDVCGKGVAAGMWTPCLVGLVRAHAAAGAGPQTIVSGVNRELCRMIGPLASMLLVRLDPASGRLDYCSAGHPPMLLLRDDGQLEWLSVGGMLLGMAPDAPFEAGHVELRPGDVLLACTDGVLEAHNGADEDFGYDRLEAQLRLARARPADALLFSVLGAVQDFVAPLGLMDDTSLMVVRYRAPGP